MKLRTSTRIASALLLFAVAPFAFAATQAGQTVTNNASVSYKIGTVDQTVVPSNALSFKVDRKIDLVVAKVGDASGSPGSTANVLQFTVQNNSNDQIDIALTAINDGTGAFTATNLKYYIEAGSGQTFDGTETESQVLDDLDEGDIWTVYVVADFPGTATDGQTDAYWLVAEATDDTATPFAETNTADDPDVVENVFADGNGPAPSDDDQDGKHSALATYTITAANLTVAKSYKVIYESYDVGTSTGTNYTDNIANLKPIPGALVEYCILVTNGGGTNADSTVVTDQLGAGGNTVSTYADYLEESMRIGGDCSDYDGATVQTDDVDGLDDSSWNSGTGTVSVGLGTVASGGGTKAALFRVVLK